MNEKKFEVVAKEPLYEGYFRADRWQVRHTTHAGGWSAVHPIEVFDRGHAVSVLAWDPAADTVVLVEQFRAAAIATTDDPWLLEAIAGAVKPGESPEEVARREAIEEAGLELGELRYVTRFLPSCGAMTEELHVFVARVTAPEGGALHGLDEENEDIRVHVLPFAEVLALVEDGAIVAGNTVVPVLWLALHKDEMRQVWA